MGTRGESKVFPVGITSSLIDNMIDVFLVTKKLTKTSEDWFGGCDTYRIVYLLYILLGVFVLRRKYFDRNRFFYIIFRIVQFCCFVICTACFVTFIHDAYLKRHNIEKLSYNLGTSIFFAVALCRLFYLAIRKDDIENMLDVMNNNLYLWDIGSGRRDLEIINSGERQFKNISKVFYGFWLAGVVAKVFCHAFSEKSFIIPIPQYEDVGSPYYEIMFVVEVVLFSHFVFVVTCLDLVTFGIFMRISRHFMILSKNIDDLVGVCFPAGNLSNGTVVRLERFRVKNNSQWQQEKTYALLRKNVMHHQEIIKTVDKVRKSMHEIFFIQIFGVGLLLVDLLFHLSLQNASATLMILCQFIYSGSSLLNITILCYYGSEIQTKSHDAAKALYAIPWLEMDLRNRKMMVFFQMALWRHPTIKAGNVFSINLNMYIKFLHSIYTYLAFMQKTLRTFN